MDTEAEAPNPPPIGDHLIKLTAEAAGVEWGRTEDLWRRVGKSERQTDKLRNLRKEGYGTGKVMKFIRGSGDDLKGYSGDWGLIAKISERYWT